MSDADETTKWFFCFRVLNPAGHWVVEGPFATNDQALAARQQAKSWQGQVTVPFIAKSKEEAITRCDIF